MLKLNKGMIVKKMKILATTVLVTTIAFASEAAMAFSFGGYSAWGFFGGYGGY